MTAPIGDRESTARASRLALWLGLAFAILIVVGVLIIASWPTTTCAYVFGQQTRPDTLVIDRKEWTLPIGNGGHGFRSPRIIVRYSFSLRDGQDGSYSNVPAIGPDLDLYHGQIIIERAGGVPVAAMFRLDHSAMGLSQGERDLFDGKMYAITEVTKALPPF